MKPFNLERALAGDPVITRDGTAVEQIVHFESLRFPHAQLVYGVVDRTVYSWYGDGRYMSNSSSSKDLFMAPRKRTVWVNLYSDNARHAWHYESQEKADRNIGPGRIGDRAYPIEIEE